MVFPDIFPHILILPRNGRFRIPFPASPYLASVTTVFAILFPRGAPPSVHHKVSRKSRSDSSAGPLYNDFNAAIP